MNSLVSDSYEKDLGKYEGQEIEFVISEFNPRRNRVIGDRRQDLECARSCKSPFIGCLYGYGEKGELDGADYFVKSVEEITGII